MKNRIPLNLLNCKFLKIIGNSSKSLPSREKYSKFLSLENSEGNLLNLFAERDIPFKAERLPISDGIAVIFLKESVSPVILPSRDLVTSLTGIVSNPFHLSTNAVEESVIVVGLVIFYQRRLFSFRR